MDRVARFIFRLRIILRKRRIVTFGLMDSVNEFVYKRRKELDPQFEVPQAHQNRMANLMTAWKELNEAAAANDDGDDDDDEDEGEASDGDSALSSEDSDDDALSIDEKREWIHQVLEHIQYILTSLNVAEKTEFRELLIGHLNLKVKERQKLVFNFT